MPDRRPVRPVEARGSEPSVGSAALDAVAVAASFDRLSAILADMMATVEEVSRSRCPYKNRHGRCTAQFGCRNQRRPSEPGGLRVCGGDDKLDYRSAWETR